MPNDGAWGTRKTFVARASDAGRRDLAQGPHQQGSRSTGRKRRRVKRRACVCIWSCKFWRHPRWRAVVLRRTLALRCWWLWYLRQLTQRRMRFPEHGGTEAYNAYITGRGKRSMATRLGFPNSTIRCFNCGKRGHMARNCPQKQRDSDSDSDYNGKCNYCGIRGHREKNCRKKRKDSKRNKTAHIVTVGC